MVIVKGCISLQPNVAFLGLLCIFYEDSLVSWFRALKNPEICLTRAASGYRWDSASDRQRWGSICLLCTPQSLDPFTWPTFLPYFLSVLLRSGLLLQPTLHRIYFALDQSCPHLIVPSSFTIHYIFVVPGTGWLSVNSCVMKLNEESSVKHTGLGEGAR